MIRPETAASHFLQRFVKIGSGCTQRGFRLSDQGMDGASIFQWLDCVGRSLARGKFEQFVDSGPGDTKRRARERGNNRPKRKFVQRSLICRAGLLVRRQERRAMRRHKYIFQEQSMIAASLAGHAVIKPIGAPFGPNRGTSPS